MKHRLGNSPRCFECKYYEEAKDVLQRKATSQQITPAYECKKEGVENE